MSSFVIKDYLTALKLFSVVCCYDGKDGNGLKLGKIGPIFSSFDAMSSEITKIIIMVSSP